MIRKQCENHRCKQTFWTTRIHKRFCCEDCNAWKRRPRVFSDEVRKATHERLERLTFPHITHGNGGEK